MSDVGGYMKFQELPQKWKIAVTILRIMAVGLPIAFIVNVINLEQEALAREAEAAISEWIRLM